MITKNAVKVVLFCFVFIEYIDTLECYLIPK